MMMNCPRAAAIPDRSAEPYPRAATFTTRAPSFLAISTEPSVEPLSATTTSPRSPEDRIASSALPTQMPMEFASFRHGMTTETSTGLSDASGDDCVVADGSVILVSVVVKSGFSAEPRARSAYCGFPLQFARPPLSWRLRCEARQSSQAWDALVTEP